LSDVEKRLTAVETRARELESRTGAKIKALELALSRSVELTQTLESQARESNEKILQLSKDAEFGREFRGLLEKAYPVISTGTSGEVLGKLTNVRYIIEKSEETRKLPAADTASCRGRLLKLMETGFFDKKKATAEIVEEFPRRGWADEEKTVANTLAQLFADALIARERKTGQPIMYWKPEGVVFVEPEAKP